MKRVALVLLAILTLGACKPDPRNTCGPKVPFSECIK